MAETPEVPLHPPAAGKQVQVGTLAAVNSQVLLLGMTGTAPGRRRMTAAERTGWVEGGHKTGLDPARAERTELRSADTLGNSPGRQALGPEDVDGGAVGDPSSAGGLWMGWGRVLLGRAWGLRPEASSPASSPLDHCGCNTEMIEKSHVIFWAAKLA